MTESDNPNLADRFLSVADFELGASSYMPANVLAYVALGAGNGITLRSNGEAFDRILLRPHVLRDVSCIQTEVTLFGEKLPLPLLLAPTAFHRMIHPEGELATARGAGAKGVTYVVSSFATTSIEEISSTATSPLWFQLYPQFDQEFTRDLVTRAENAGCRALCVTVDTPVFGRRAQRTKVVLSPEMDTPHMYPAIRCRPDLASLYGRVPRWKDIEWLRSFAKIPILLKGILDPEDADQAVAAGVQGVIVSNHGARSLDTVPPTIQALPAIVDRVAGRVPILIDGGIRRGTDVLKCLAHGADAVLIGRPYLYGLAAAGAEGVARVIQILQTELEFAMKFCGYTAVSEINRKALW